MQHWYAVIERITGELVSTGTVLADPLPADLEALALTEPVNFETQAWDVPGQQFVARTAPDPLPDLVAVFKATWLEQPETVATAQTEIDRTWPAIERILRGEV